MDMVACLRLLAELDYKYMVMPDHVPHLSGTGSAAPAAPKSDYRDVTMPDHAPAQPGGANDAAAFAYCFGYIRALLQVLKAEYPDRIEL